MIQKIKRYINYYHMLSPGDKVVLGLSGGADSVCLFFVLCALEKELLIQLQCVHVNHGIRKGEADKDQQFVEQLCKSKGKELHTFSFNAQLTARQRKISVEEAGREYRYSVFRKVMEESAYNKIATAHHQGDQAETILFHLCRGSSLTGLVGIEPIKDELIRPLLCVNKQEIEEWLRAQHISWRVDSTNLTADYMRNKIRLEILPILEREINSQASLHIALCGESLREAKYYIEKKGEEAYNRIAEESEERIILNLEKLKREEAVIQKQVLRLTLVRLKRELKDITAKHYRSVLELIEKQVGRQIDLGKEIQAIRTYSSIIVMRKKQIDRVQSHKINVAVGGCYELPDHRGTISIGKPIDLSDLDEIEIKKNPGNACTKWIDYDRIKDILQLRTRKEGDYFLIGKENKKKKLKSYFIDEKIPQSERDQIWLLADGSHILWVIGYRMSSGCYITKGTRRAIKVQLNGGK